ncbi:hypothetical protein [Janibacter melonis]|uniref:hypothetical protein n=1 Tax=Janibacter melonis TaxID=262209 RepID=UPI001F3791F0|nr:hypothetical protein [Janibacter melonis]
MFENVPPGWPDGVRPPGTSGWQGDVAGWLLDQCPPDYRAHDVLRRHPVALAWLARLHVRAQVDATRQAYREARVAMVAELPAGTLEPLLAALEAEGRRLRTAEHGVELVRDALAGRPYVPRM